MHQKTSSRTYPHGSLWRRAESYGMYQLACFWLQPTKTLTGPVAHRSQDLESVPRQTFWEIQRLKDTTEATIFTFVIFCMLAQAGGWWLPSSQALDSQSTHYRGRKGQFLLLLLFKTRETPRSL